MELFNDGDRKYWEPGATALRRAGIAAKCCPDGSARIAVGDPAAGRAVLAAIT
jgi:histidinol-phosphate aminotransferase